MIPRLTTLSANLELLTCGNKNTKPPAAVIKPGVNSTEKQLVLNVELVGPHLVRTDRLASWMMSHVTHK